MSMLPSGREPDAGDAMARTATGAVPCDAVAVAVAATALAGCACARTGEAEAVAVAAVATLTRAPDAPCLRGSFR